MIKAHDIIRSRGLLRMVNPDFPSPALVEYLGGCGFDAVFLDCEHQFAGLERIQDLARAAHYAGMIALVRPEMTHPAILVRYLDAGADGLIIPHVDTAADARAIVETVREARWKDHERIYINVLMESPTAIANLPSILEIEGLTSVLFGAVDLSQAMGFPGQPRHPEVVQAVERSIPLVQKAGLMAGAPKDLPGFAEHRERGGCVVSVHANLLLAQGAKAHLAGLS